MSQIQNVLLSFGLAIAFALCSCPAFDGLKEKGWAGLVAHLFVFLFLGAAALLFLNAIFRAVFLVILA